MQLKIIRAIFILGFVLVLNNLFSQSKHGFAVSNDVFGRRVFIENKGQFDDMLPNKQKIKYAYLNGKEQVYFTPTGLTYILQEPKPLTEHEREGIEHGKKNDLKSAKKYFVDVIWENSNPNIQMIESDIQPFYHSFGDAKFKSNCYKKITYKNVYNHIDIEYVFTQERKTGIKYNVILHPGANVNDIKIKYSGDVKNVIEKNGTIIIKTAISTITELAPLSYQNEIKVESKFKLTKHTISFELPHAYDTTKELIIDPWVVNLSTLDTNDYAYDVDYDYAGNYYVYGGSGPFLISKYTAAGVLAWTFNGTVPSISWTSLGAFPASNFIGNFVVHKKSGKTYIGEGFQLPWGTRIVRLDQNGIYDNFVSIADQNWCELWDMAYDCNTGDIYGLGGSPGTEFSGGILNTTTGTVALRNFTGIIPTGFQDIVSHAIDQSGTMFFVFASNTTTLVNNCLLRVNSTFNGNDWIAPSTYTTFVEPLNKIYPGIAYNSSNGYNALAVNNNYLYYYDGFNLAAYDKLTGTKLGFTTITGLTAKKQGGIAVDACDNIYIGGNGSILCFNFNGTNFTTNGIIPVASATVNKYVTDIKYDAVTNELFVCGSGFGGIYTAINSTNCNSPTITTTCTGTNGSAVVTVTTNIVAPLVSYTWSTSGGTLISQTINASSLTNSVSGLSNGTYSVFIQANAPCGPVWTQTFNINCTTCSIPTLGVISGTNTICEGLTSTYSVAPVAGATSYNWILPNGWSGTSTTNTISVLSGISGGTMSVTVTNTCGISLPSTFSVVVFSITASVALPSTLTCNATTLSLSASGGGTYNWSGPGIVSGSATATPIVNLPGLYNVTVTAANGCSATASTTVTQNTIAPMATAATTGTLTCSTTTISLIASGGGTYNWSGPGIVSGATTANPIINLPGVYSLTVTGTNGCTTTTVIAVTQNTTPPIASGITCEPLTCLHPNNAIAGCCGTGTYFWSGPGIVSGATTANPVVNLPGVYNLTLTASNGCIATSNVTVSQNTIAPVISIFNPGPLTCNTQSIALIGTGGGSYSWSGPGIISGATTATVIVNTPGIYNLTVTANTGFDPNGCSAVATTTVIQISSTPTIIVSPDVMINAGSLTQLSVIGNGSNYVWSPVTSLSCMTCTNPIASPVVTTTYCVLSSIGTCTAQACVLVTVKENCDGNKRYEAPNAFSPNGDGYNDEFCLQGWEGCVTGFSIKIYDRWGEKVYESADENFCWDGVYQGKLLDPAVFVFCIQANIMNVGEVTKKGNITLIR